jgi:hypothetical protein
MRVLGIDPGITGAMVCIENGVICGVAVMPTVVVQKSSKTKKGNFRTGTEYVESEMFRRLELLRPGYVFLEKSIAMPGQAAQATASIWLGQGLLRGMITALKVPYAQVAAATWQKVMLADYPKGERTKESAALVCSRRWPSWRWFMDGAKTPHSGLCDAALIAAYGERQLQQDAKKVEPQ